MKNLQTTFKPLILILAMAFAFASCSSDDDNNPEPPVVTPEGVIISSLFQNDAEGWKITGDAQGGYVEPTYLPDGGVIEGFIYAEDNVTGGWWYFTAPDSYLGAKLNYYGATLTYHQYQESDRVDQRQKADIIFKSGTKQITYVHGIANFPSELWTEYQIPISAGNGWIKGAFDSGVTATEADIKDVLSNITEFSIRGEFEHGPDSGGLDKVEITQE